MADIKDELEKSLEGTEKEELSDSEKRIKDLSSKVKSTSKERDEAMSAKEKAEQELAMTKKEMEFVSAFSEQVSKYPAAKEHRDEIKQKVMSGYSVEDATVAILNKNNKLKTAEEVNREQIRTGAIGGSADITMHPQSNKSPSEMTQEERRKALLQAEQDGTWGFSDGNLWTRR